MEEKPINQIYKEINRIYKELEIAQTAVECRNEMVEILKTENVKLAEENQMLMNKVLELEYKK